MKRTHITKNMDTKKYLFLTTLNSVDSSTLFLKDFLGILVKFC